MPDETLTVCRFCGAPTELESNRVTLPGGREVPASRWWRGCLRVTCRARGPVALTKEGADAAYVKRV